MDQAELYVSPHLDDVALSCGGAVAAARADRAVFVATVFAAPLDLSCELPQAVRFHAIMGLAAATSRPDRRRDEDERALAHLGARPLHLDFADCIYRRRPDGSPLVSRDEDVFSDLAEPALERAVASRLARLLTELSPARLVLPLGLGGHRDHLAARRAGEAAFARAGAGCELWYYEDAPYSFRLATPDEAAAAAPAASRAVLFPFSERELAARLEAVAEYASQSAVVWGGPGCLAEAISRHARSLGGKGGLAERQWRLSGRCGGS